jgi:hypothetical protein
VNNEIVLMGQGYSHVTHVAAASMIGTMRDIHPFSITVCEAGDEVVAKTIWKPISSPMAVELKQFDLLTSGTSCGSAKVISAHYCTCQPSLP